jgi:hypothetical protein
MDNFDLENHCMVIRQQGICDVHIYKKRLFERRDDPSKISDLIFEGWVAYNFATHGFRVTFRESPDLLVEHSGYRMFTEVKRFRRKQQDMDDEKRLREYGGELIEYGNTLELEGVEAWDQVVNVCKTKSNKLANSVINIIAIGSDSSHCIDDSIMPTAVNIINEMGANLNNAEIRRLSAVMLFSRDFNLTKHRSVYIYPLLSSQIAIPAHLLDKFHNIRQWVRI